MRYLLIALLLFIWCDEDPVSPIHGCLDSEACNYNSSASIDNNSCTYADEGYDCQGSMISCMPSDEIGICPHAYLANPQFDESCWCKNNILLVVNDTDGAFFTFSMTDAFFLYSSIPYYFDDYIITSVQNQYHEPQEPQAFNWTTNGDIATIEIIGFQSWADFFDLCLLNNQPQAIVSTTLTFNHLIIVEE